MHRPSLYIQRQPSDPLGDGLMARQRTLTPLIGVRIPVPQQVNAPVAQLDRAFGYGPKGWGFESSWAYNLKWQIIQ